MFRYLKAAFLVRAHLPGLGAFPINVVSAACFVILGFAHPGFWLLGLGVELAFVTALAGNRRFQRVVDALDQQRESVDAETRRDALVRRLDAEGARRLAALERRCDRVMSLHGELGSDVYVVQSSADATRHLRWAYFKLLLARQYLTSDEVRADERTVLQQMAALERDLAAGTVSAQVRQSKAATLEILKKRLRTIQQREESLRAIDSDLERIEAQVDLAVEAAAVRGQVEAAAPSAEVALASDLLDPAIYGSSAPAVAELDPAFHSTLGRATPTR